MNVDTSKKLSVNKLQQGLVYIAKDGRLLLYCGIINGDEYMFYLVGSVNIITNLSSDSYIYNHSIMHPHVISSVTELMKKPIILNGVCYYKAIPHLVCAYPDLDFSVNGYVPIWLAKSKILVKEFPAKINFTEKKPPVKVKDLVKGRVYTTATDEDYVYLGRDSLSNFCWCYIGNHEAFANDPQVYLSWGIFRVDKTKAIKRLSGVSSRYPDLIVDLRYTKFRYN